MSVYDAARVAYGVCALLCVPAVYLYITWRDRRGR